MSPHRRRECNDEDTSLRPGARSGPCARTRSWTRAGTSALLVVLRGAVVEQREQVGRREALREARVRVLELRGKRRRRCGLVARGAAGLGRRGAARDLVAQVQQPLLDAVVDGLWGGEDGAGGRAGWSGRVLGEFASKTRALASAQRGLAR